MNDDQISELQQDLSLGSGLGLLALNRKPLSNGVSYGGVAVVWRESTSKLSRIFLKNPHSYEVMVTAASLNGHSRKLVLVACYLPPGYDKERGRGAVDYIESVLIELKRRYQDPYVIVGGDFNQWKIGGAMDNFVDMKEIDVGPTRGNKTIDRVFTNMSRSIIESGTVTPLVTEDDEDGQTRKSDHRVVFCKFLLQRRTKFRWVSYSYRHYNEDSAKKFREWIVFHDWAEVFSSPDTNTKAEAYQRTVVEAVERFFPLRKVRRKDNDPPWMDKRTKKMIKDRKKLYSDEGGRTLTWKDEKKRTNEQVLKRKRGFLDRQKESLLGDGDRNFYRQVRNFGKAERPKLFDVRDLMPEGQTDEQTAEELASFFNRISDEFDPLGPGDIPCTREKELPELHEYEVAARIRRFKKPKSTVPGDIFPQLVTQFADFLAPPLTDIYNCITVTRTWPTCWKKEYVTVIPKKSNPQSLSDLRNISCTLFTSKIYESYILDWLKLEVHLRSNQYGGVKGLSTDHLLVNFWQQVLENAEDYRAGTVVTSIDYSKAFNRMGFQECLRALARNGASSPLLEIVATFLTGREMVVKVGSVLSKPKKVNGGCPQGSILGVFLFNATIDDLEEGCEELPETRRSRRTRPAAVPSTPRQ